MTADDLLPEVRGTLLTLRERKVKIAIGSSSKNAPLILDKIGLSSQFDAISDGNNISQSKPHPEVFLKAAEMLGVAPEDCLVVEDAEAGVEAALRAGMKAAAIGDARNSDKAHYKLLSIRELLRIR
ncbi:Beta-phosphoglucomutase [compost metagenome]